MEISIITEELSPVFKKYHIKGLPLEASFNEFTDPDTGDPHDHPFDFYTYIISGGYIERKYGVDGKFYDIHRKPGTCHYVKATDIHQIIDLPDKHCVTLMIPQSGHIKPVCFYRFIDNKSYVRQWNEQEFKEITE